MSRRFEGMAALVTGAASGIGRATAKLLAGEGARVACADIGEEKLAEATEEIREGGGEAIAIALDVADSDSCNAAVARCIDEWGGLGVLANVAGVLKLEHADQLSDEDWTRVIGINLSGTFFMSRAAIPHLLDGGGSIVNVASLAGLKGQAYGSAYCASKAGVVALTRVMAVECEKAALEHHDRIENSQGATVTSHAGYEVYATSTGFWGENRKTRHGISCSVIGQRQDGMQRDYWYSSCLLYTSPSPRD